MQLKPFWKEIVMVYENKPSLYCDQTEFCVCWTINTCFSEKCCSMSKFWVCIQELLKWT